MQPTGRGRPLTCRERGRGPGWFSDIISEVDAILWPTQHWCFVPVLQPGPRGGDPVNPVVVRSWSLFGECIMRPNSSANALPRPPREQPPAIRCCIPMRPASKCIRTCTWSACRLAASRRRWPYPAVCRRRCGVSVRTPAICTPSPSGCTSDPGYPERTPLRFGRLGRWRRFRARLRL